MDTFEITREILRSSLQLGQRADQLQPDTPLLGHIPELNSLTVMGIISSIEEQLGCTVGDREISADLFESVAALQHFIEQKITH